MIHDPLETTQYRLFLITEFEKDKDNGVFIGKAHHSMSDGLATMQFFFTLSYHYDSESIVGMKPLPLGKRMIIWLTMPFNVIVESLRHVVKFKDKNALKKKDQKITGVKNGRAGTLMTSILKASKSTAPSMIIQLLS